MDSNNNSIKDRVLQAIATGRVAMRPRWHFVLRAGLLVVGTILAALSVLYLVSFIFFVLRENRLWFVPAFGLRGWGVFFSSLPWLLLLLAALFILLLEILVRKYSFAFRKPLLYSTLGIVVLVLVGGFGLEETRIHHGLLEQARQNNLPIAGGFYRAYGLPPQDHLADGIIQDLIERGYRIRDRRDQTMDVIVTDDTAFPTGRDLMIGDTIIVIGDRHANTITAAGIRRIAPGIPDLRPRPTSPGLK
jgi:hypothetical protein